MNRAERRKQKNAVPAKPKTYVLTEDQIIQLKREAVNEASRKAFLMLMAIPIMVLHDKFGFGRTRLKRFMEYAMVWFDSVYDNETRLMEIVEIAREECGVNVNDYKQEKRL